MASISTDQIAAPFFTSNALTVPFGATVWTRPSPTTGGARSVSVVPPPPISADQAREIGAWNFGLPPACPPFSPGMGAALIFTISGSPAPSARAAGSAVSTVTSGNTPMRVPFRIDSGCAHEASSRAMTSTSPPHDLCRTTERRALVDVRRDDSMGGSCFRSMW